MKATWFQIHWAIGVSAGIVLAVVGVTGACLSFQNEILHLLNPGVMTIAQKAEPRLAPAELLARLAAAHPEKRVASLTVYAARDHAVRVMFAVKPSGAGPGARRSEVRYANPYTGELLGEPRGAGFFRLAMETHRWLAAGAVGKHVVGACTIALVVMCLSGLYLRWQRRPLDWRAWLTFDWTRRGRGFLRDLHAAVGTWVLIPYLVMGLTGLHWSYDWYRDALYALTGAPRPAPSGGTARAPSTREGTAGSGAPREKAVWEAASNAQKPDLAAVWRAFERTAGAYASATLRVSGGPRQPVQVTYLRADSAHDRAFDRVVLDARSGAVLKHERYADKSGGAKLMSSVFALHSGRFFGVLGAIALMLASALMPLFAITGWMLYLGRRTRRKRATPAGEAVPAHADTRMPL